MKSWRIRTIGEVTTIVNGGTPKSELSEYWNGDVFWITPKDMGKLESIYVSNTSRKISQSGLQKSSAKLIPNNSVILSTRAPIGHLAINQVAMATNQGCRGLVPKSDIDTKFLFYFLKLNTQLLDDLGTGTTFKELSTNSLAGVKIPLPPLPEQKRIVEILDEAFEGIDRAIALAEKNLANARELFESYLNAIFTQKGDGWEKKKLGDIATFRNGLNFTKSSKGESIKIVGVKDFQNHFWIQEAQLDSVTIDTNLKEIDILRKGDILAVRSNGNKELIGRCVLADELSEKTSHSGFTIRIRIERKDIYPQFIVHYLKSRELRKQLVESGGGISISSLNQQGLSLIIISFPTFLEQKAIVANIDEIASETQRLENIYRQKIAALNELKQSILQKAFTGELTADTPKAAKEVTAA